MAGDNTGLERGLRLLRDYGFVRVDRTPATMDDTQAVVERVASLRPTFYGKGMWKTEIKPGGGNDTAFTTIPLGAHTDGNYLADTPGVQVFHCLKADTSGGDNVLVDAFTVVEWLREHHPDTFAFLTQTELPFHHTDPENMVMQWRRILTLDDDGDPLAFNFNNDDRAGVTLRTYTGSYSGVRPAGAAHSHPSFIPELYTHLLRLLKALTDPEFEVWMPLRPGTVLIFDNTRVLHGRSGFSVESGRILAGCYLSKEDWHSRLRSLSAAAGTFTPREWL